MYGFPIFMNISLIFSTNKKVYDEFHVTPIQITNNEIILLLLFDVTTLEMARKSVEFEK